MEYNYVVVNGFSCKRRKYVVTNDIVLAKKYLFNCVVTTLENNDDKGTDLKCYNYSPEWRGKGAIQHLEYDLEHGFRELQEVLEAVLSNIHKDINKYWNVFGDKGGKQLRIDDYHHRKYDFDVKECTIGFSPDADDDYDDLFLGYEIVPLNAVDIKREYEDNRRKYNITDTFTNE